jgi:hypothetical protein
VGLRLRSGGSVSGRHQSVPHAISEILRTRRKVGSAAPGDLLKPVPWQIMAMTTIETTMAPGDEKAAETYSH